MQRVVAFSSDKFEMYVEAILCFLSIVKITILYLSTKNQIAKINFVYNRILCISVCRDINCTTYSTCLLINTSRVTEAA